MARNVISNRGSWRDIYSWCLLHASSDLYTRGFQLSGKSPSSYHPAYFSQVESCSKMDPTLALLTWVCARTIHALGLAFPHMSRKKPLDTVHHLFPSSHHLGSFQDHLHGCFLWDYLSKLCIAFQYVTQLSSQNYHVSFLADSLVLCYKSTTWNPKILVLKAQWISYIQRILNDAHVFLCNCHLMFYISLSLLPQCRWEAFEDSWWTSKILTLMSDLPSLMKWRWRPKRIACMVFLQYNSPFCWHATQ